MGIEKAFQGKCDSSEPFVYDGDGPSGIDNRE
jgi:hypothetical protein